MSTSNEKAMRLALDALEDSQLSKTNTAIKALEEALAQSRSDVKQSDSVEQGEQDNYQGSDAAKAAHMVDLYTALGVRWGDDPFAVIAKMRSIAGTEKQERPTGPATSADRYFYEAGFEAGRQQGIKQEQGEPVAWRTYTGRGYYVIDPTLEEAQKNWPDRTHQPLYTTPQQRPSRSDIKPLTEEQIMALLVELCVPAKYEGVTETFTAVVRIIEAAHGIIKENT